jgi:plasmid maintenance system antidote protein VapI
VRELEDKQFTRFLGELDLLKKLLILNTLKSGADQTEVAKVLGITDRQVRNILAGKA